jgi:6-phosphogluconolactonase
MKWTVLENPDEVARNACVRILQISKRAIARRGAFHIVLAGGSTPEKTYEMLSEADSDWHKWHIWFGDERCLPVGHPERNSVMVERALTSRVAIPSEQVHIIHAEKGPETAAKHYAELLEAVPLFDMVLLGMGEDGHTASLFPEYEYPEGKTVLPVYDAPKFPAERVSLSVEMLSQCRYLLFIITGKGKSAAVSRWQQGEILPVSMIRGIEKTEALIDKAVSVGTE